MSGTFLVVLAVGAFLPGLSDQPYWDDRPLPRQLPFFTSFDSLLNPPSGIPDWPYNYFRPVALALLLLDARLFDSPLGGHAMNLAYHAIASLLVFVLGRRLLGGYGESTSMLAATLGAAVFATHPVHVESVCWVVARVDILATLFSILTVLLALTWRDSRSVLALLLAPLAYLLALGSKEVAIATSVLAPLAVLLAPPRNAGERPSARERATTLVPLVALIAAATVVYFAYRVDAVTRVTLGLRDQPALETAVRLVQATGWYLQKLVFPWPQSNFVVPDMLPGAALAGLTVTAGLASGAWALREVRRTGDGVPLFGLLWLAAGIAPALVLAVTKAGATPVAERYLYFPSAGAAIVLAAVIARWLPGPRARLATGAAVLIVVAFLAGSLLRSQLWASNTAIWSDATRQALTHATPFSELGIAWQAEGDDDRALQAYRQARGLEGDPATLAAGEYNAGLIWLKRGELTEALGAFRAARNLKPDYPLAHYGLGRVYQEQARQPTGQPPAEDLVQRIDLYGLAQRSLAEAILLNPSSGEARLQLIRVLLEQGDLVASAGRTDDARTSYRAARNQLEAMLTALPGLLEQPGIAELLAELRRKGAGP
ncbi:MAG: tetratricopeptide repeat protein [Gammaproteobacteria bacterium]